MAALEGVHRVMWRQRMGARCVLCWGLGGLPGRGVRKENHKSYREGRKEGSTREKAQGGKQPSMQGNGRLFRKEFYGKQTVTKVRTEKETG